MPLSQQQFLEQRAARRGVGNAQRMTMPLWEELIRTGENAYIASTRYGCDPQLTNPAGWCFYRFGMTRTRLPDGRIICVGGEHEDFYDPDFFIYNDVILIQPDGLIEIYGYSLETFPPTDFHTATLVGDAIYLVGSLGYQGHRGTSTQIYRLNTKSMLIHQITFSGNDPGWLQRHRAELAADGHSIRIAGGTTRRVDSKDEEAYVDNPSVYQFDTQTSRWSIANGIVPTLASRSHALPPGWIEPENQTKAQAVRDAIIGAVGPDHPLFCGEFWPVAEWRQTWRWRVALQMLNSPQWAICDDPDTTGRETPPLVTNLYSNESEFIGAAATIGDEDQT